MDSGVGEPVMDFPSIELITTAGWSAPIAIDDRTVHVWGFSLEGGPSFVEQCRTWMSEDERGRAARFIRQQDQLRFAMAHGGLRAVLARYTGIHPSALTFQLGSTGKPALLVKRALQHPLQFNLSHSHGRILIALAGEQDVGADLELIRDEINATKLAERFYAPAERDRVINLSGQKKIQWFYRYWVAKEAVLKGQAVGLRSLRQCEILASGYSPRAEIQSPEGATFQPGWTIHWVDCGAGWVGAVSAYGRDWVIRIMTRA